VRGRPPAAVNELNRIFLFIFGLNQSLTLSVSDGGRPPSWICLGTFGPPTVVFITVQNLVAIDAAVSKI